MPIRKILVPTDFSPSAEQAVARALTMARTLGAHVTLLHAFQPTIPVELETAPLCEGGRTGKIGASARAALEAARVAAAKRLTGSLGAIDAVFSIGTPFLRIIDEARRGHYDLVVMGTNGRRGLPHLLLGSVAEEVMRSAPCPVMTVHAPPAIAHHAAG